MRDGVKNRTDKYNQVKVSVSNNARQMHQSNPRTESEYDTKTLTD